ncbi:hypothetical protein [Halorussus salinus]|uniref:hypothetical protein n=1 Tax=Halorussus salinus TaxID=1364935 RepID=UPI001091F179|nr:hypothetical protein [Halorussus salinus]
MTQKQNRLVSRRTTLKSLGASVGATGILGSAGSVSADDRQHVKPSPDASAETITFEEFEDSVSIGRSTRNRVLSQYVSFDAYQNDGDREWRISVETDLSGVMAYDDGSASKNFVGADIEVDYPDKAEDDAQFRDDSDWVGRWGTYEERNNNEALDFLSDTGKQVAGLAIDAADSTIGTAYNVVMDVGEFVTGLVGLTKDGSMRTFEWDGFGGSDPTGIAEFSVYARFEIVMNPGQKYDIDITGTGLTNTTFSNPRTVQKFTLEAPDE